MFNYNNIESGCLLLIWNCIMRLIKWLWARIPTYFPMQYLQTTEVLRITSRGALKMRKLSQQFIILCLLCICVYKCSLGKIDKRGKMKYLGKEMLQKAIGKPVTEKSCFIRLFPQPHWEGTLTGLRCVTVPEHQICVAQELSLEAEWPFFFLSFIFS